MRESYIKDVSRIADILEDKDHLIEYDEAWMNKKVKSKKTGRTVKVGSLDPSERAQYRPKAEQKPAHVHAAEALAKLGNHKLADKVIKDPKSHSKVADWAEDENHHGIAAMLRADKDTDVETLAHGETSHHNFDNGKKPKKYEGERDDALVAKYQATNPDKRLGEKDEFDKWGADRHLQALRYLHSNNLHHTDTYKRLADKVNKHKDAYKKVYDKELQGHKDDLSRYKKEISKPKDDYTKGDYNYFIKSAKSNHKATQGMGKALGLDK